MPPETHYARSGDVSIAYQVLGDGPFDIVFVPPSVSNVELGWEVPNVRTFLEQLGSFSRLIHFDKRGTGMSDPVAGAPRSRRGWTMCARLWTPSAPNARLSSAGRRASR